LGSSNWFRDSLAFGHLLLPAWLTTPGTPGHGVGNGIRLRSGDGLGNSFSFTLGLHLLLPTGLAAPSTPRHWLGNWIRLGCSNWLGDGLSFSHLFLPARLTTPSAPRHGVGNGIGLRSCNRLGDSLALSLHLLLPTGLAAPSTPGHRISDGVGLRLRNGITLLRTAEVLTASLADGIGILVALPNELLAWLALVVEVAERGEEIWAKVVDGGRRRRCECGSGHHGQSNEGVFHPRRLCLSSECFEV
jgi:hypothetical protein